MRICKENGKSGFQINGQRKQFSQRKNLPLLYTTTKKIVKIPTIIQNYVKFDDWIYLFDHFLTAFLLPGNEFDQKYWMEKRKVVSTKMILIKLPNCKLFLSVATCRGQSH